MADQPRARLHFAVVAPDVTAEHHPTVEEADALALLRQRAEAHAGQLFTDGFELEVFGVMVNLTDVDGAVQQYAAGCVAVGTLPEAIPSAALGWDVRLAPTAEEDPRG